MIVAAGLGTRLRPLTELRPKPALPVRGIPLIAYTLALLARHGVTEAIINAHHLPDILMDAARRHCPAGIDLRFSIEAELLDTGGGIRRVADFPARKRPLPDRRGRHAVGRRPVGAGRHPPRAQRCLDNVASRG